ncbi:GARS/AIRS/GART-like protein [Euroglyphus maynei]|uniref:Trifunctional purine biosynthetic protein adenosine-3 n=1 Tax=Euroglyphus maynei TaxID=6958 RepID=A0A1Y3BSV6_EURMA|nr:GARS/AIRS/GART-like protein [Euroglyphus maynei]
MSKKVLVIGNGSREHCIAWKLSQSSKVSNIIVSPGNGGLSQCGGKISMLDLNVSNHNELIEWCRNNQIDLVVVGPEDPLSKGISDSLNSNGILCFGPSQKAARIESDKAFAKNFMKKYNIPTASFQNFTDHEKAKEYVRSTGALVIKASGLAGGKGVIVAKTIDEACEAIDDMMMRKKFGKAGDEIVVEELLEGDEVSVFAMTDGVNHRILLPAQDHKRAYDNDEGPNTGGMGAYCPYPFLNDEQLDLIRENIIQKTIDGMRQEGHPFVGLLYAGLMITPHGPKVIEFNCRFGDPETQSILSLLKSDIFDHFMACMYGQVDGIQFEWDDRYAVGIVLASGGYPGPIVKNIEIHGLNILNQLNDVHVFYSGTALKDGNLVTSGGRIMTIVALDHSLKQASIKARNAVSMIKIEKSFFRNDIASKAIRRLETQINYKQSGVDIDAGNKLVEHIKEFARRTTRSGVMEQIGGFGALFDMSKLGMKDPILVSGTDGVGTKLKIAIDTGILNTVGIDLVAMCVNDILVQGAEPLFFLDYLACSRLQVNRAADIIKGISDGCLQSNCALIGGETAEMPGMYVGDDFDLAGFAAGAVERKQLLPRKNEIAEGDVIIGLTSSGVHSNGFSMVRKIMEVNQVNFDDQFDEQRKFHDILLTPTKIYVKSLMPAIKSGKIKALAHITGGGLIENIPRILPKEFGVELDAMSWPMHEIFTWLKHAGNVADHEFQKTFNCGLGMVLIVNAKDAEAVQEQIKSSNGEESYQVGKIIRRSDRAVIVRNFAQAIERNSSKITIKQTPREKKRVAVLISGSGTNLKAIIEYVNRNAHKTCIDLVMVISNKSSAPGLQFAREAGIPVEVIVKKKIQSREEYDELLNKALENAKIDIVCLAGFMQMLTENFVNKWMGKMINIHPSILPAFKGMDAYGQALKYGVKFSGCTAHFVVPEMDAGPIIAQGIVKINPNETHDSLVERGKAVEHQIYPQALELVASGQVKFSNVE